MKRITGVKIAAAFVAFSALAACSSPGPGATTAAGVVTAFIMTDKLPTDMIAEAMTGLNCSYVDHLDDGGPICRSHDYGQVIEKPIYCYKTLGKVDCYDYPDPYATGAHYVQ